MAATGGQTALVIGGTRGIGLALVEALLDDPAYDGVIAGGRAPDPSAALDALAAIHGKRLHRVAIDLGDEAAIVDAAAQIRRLTPALHLLINTVGLLHDAQLKPERRLADVDPAALARSHAINAIGPLLVVKHFHPLLAHAERAVLATLSARVGSIADNRLGGWYAYRSAKAAQNQFMRTAAIELARRAPQLIVVQLHPGTVETALSAPFRGNVAADKLFTPPVAARHLLRVIGSLRREDSGSFRAWDGSPIPW